MKKTLSYLLFILFFTNSLPVASAYEETVESIQHDITGNHYFDSITLVGERLTNQSSYYHHVMLHIQLNPSQHVWKESLPNGYNPELTIVDVTGNNVHDILFRIADDEQQKQFTQLLYTTKNEALTLLTLPEQLSLQATLHTDNIITINDDTGELFATFNVSNKPTMTSSPTTSEKSLRVANSTYLEPVFLVENERFGLRSKYSVTSNQEHHLIGELYLSWLFADNE